MAKISTAELRRAITEIMKGADLTTMSARKIRYLCEKKFRVDLTSQKKEIDQIVMSLLEKESSSEEEEEEDEEEEENKSEVDSSEGCSTGGSTDEGSSSEGENADSESERSSAGRRSDQHESSDSEDSSNSDDSSSKKKVPEKVQRKITKASTTEKEDKGEKMESMAQAAKGKKRESKVQKPLKASANLPKKQSVPVKPTKPQKSATKILAKENKSNPQHKLHADPDRVPKKSGAAAASSKQKKQTAIKQKVDNDSVLSSQEMDDAAIARKLQAEEWNFRRRAVKKMPRKVKDGQSKPRKKSSYSRKCALSADLAEVLRTNEMARHDIIKKMWSIVRERNLLDPANKQFAFCDEQLLKVFGKRRIRLFGMMKYLKNHIKDVHGIL